MYVPEAFAVRDTRELRAFIEASAFGLLVSQVQGHPYASHLPFLLAPGGERLLTHVALQNPQHEEIDGQQVLVVFQGAHGYISPAWYRAPGVPTWNYQAVHARGPARVFRDSDRLGELVDTLARKYEAAEPEPWKPDYGPLMLTQIVGIEIHIEVLEGKYKLSQNRSAEDRAAVIEQLERRGSQELAQAMRKVDR
ncbi:FMN-binding negative transcriptional regulator [Mangrovimicrobium sediminis]|uniref:FMN-binding negative transcriptional regulator n=1 Tax=Mangrovimicrobium sediminis TaxID=2562682 RepID=A0A4Z0M497_9GAMM|nr:FMN-binding negative transcriptional regulator [Haliea sp. SAOS-164]TGD74321.1 FMN-binding negative transcriptional regulator [Haliea sp. SAOS-164]